MTRDKENIHVQSTPHFDGERENIINDPTASASTQMGVKVNTTRERNPFHYTPKLDPEMELFEKLMRGKKIGD